MASATEEDLDINPFYLALQTKFKKEFEEAQENCCLIFIPKSKSLTGQTINKKFIETHILKPSPYFQGQYVTTDKNRSKCIRFEGNKIRTLEGFKESIIFEIISEERGYSKTLKPYRILIIERPFNSNLCTPESLMPRSDSYIDLDKLQSSYLECKKLLMFPEYKPTLSIFEDHIFMYKNNYVFLPSFLDEDIKKLKGIYEKITVCLLESMKNKQKIERRSDAMVKIAVESVMFKDLYLKLFTVISRRFMSEDKAIVSKIQEKYITPETLAVRQDFCCSFALSVQELSGLDNCETPLEKLACLKNTLDLISKEVMDHLKINPTYFWKDLLPVLTADDLIPLLVIVITKSKPQYLFSNIYYIENCHWSTSKIGDYGFSLITFKATQEFIKSTNFKVLFEKREMNMKELSTSTEKNISVDDSLLLPSEINQECNSQEKNSKDLKSGERKLENSNSLGNFLSALQRDTFGFGFGKQT